MRDLLLTFSWRELRHHPWRNFAAALAVMLGVALAFSVQLINASALNEFSGAIRSINGQPDLELRATHGNFPQTLYGRMAARSEVVLASPVLEIPSALRSGGPAVALRVIGVDALTLPALAPALMPKPSEGSPRFSIFAPGVVFLNAAARLALGEQSGGIALRVGSQWREVTDGGNVSAGGTPIAVMDIGAAQDLFGRGGEITRIDLRLAPGTDREAFSRALQTSADWPANVRIAQPGDAAERVGNLSRAYRVNLTVLALVALFTGAYLVFSVLALSVAKRAQQFALLGVLGMTPSERLRLVLAESLALGTIGSAAGVIVGTGLAFFALRVLGGDLGGGYFDGVTPTLQWSTPAALVYAALGIAAALVGGWWPARAAQRLPEARALKGLGGVQQKAGSYWTALLLVLAGAALALAPAVWGIPVAAYLSVGLLLVGGIAGLPWLVALLYDRLAPMFASRVLPMLSIERARRMRSTAAVAVSGVVASLSLAVALTVMVGSFRTSVTQWLDVVLPADLYIRSGGASQVGPGERGAFDPGFVQQLARLPGVARAGTLRTRPLLLDPARPSVALISRGMDDDMTRSLPLVEGPIDVPSGRIGIYVSEAMVQLYGARAGQDFVPLSRAFADATDRPFFVAGVWRDYVRQFGAIAMAARDFEALTQDNSVSDIALWLAPGAASSSVQQAVRSLAEREQALAEPLDIASVGELRATSLRIFDRSFAVTYWLQAVAIGIGLFGIAASFSAQVLARRKEFGLLAHLGFTRGQVLTVVAGEGAAWTGIGAAAGLALGLAVAVVLVKVVNPQSFHWTMDLLVPWVRLILLCATVMAAGTLTAWLAGRAAASHDAVVAVKEDW